MLETITSLIIILNASAIGLGVGSSTLAISSFLTALRDGIIDQSERSMLGVIYIVLRVAMILILLTTVIIMWQRPEIFGNQIGFFLTLIAILYINAVCMTKHWIPSKIGPAVQAATWYTMGFLASINMFHLFTITFSNFIILYAIDLLVALFLINKLVQHMSRTK